MDFKLGEEYQTRDGRIATIIAVDLKATNYSIGGHITDTLNGRTEYGCWLKTGKYLCESAESKYDLMEKVTA